MKKVTVKEGQTVHDLSLNYFGTLDISELVALNPGLDLNEPIRAGVLITVPDMVKTPNETLNNFLEKNSIISE